MHSDDHTKDSYFIRAIAKGSDSAFDTLFDKYHDILVNLAGKYTRSTTDALDIVQETFLSIFKYAHSYKERENISARSWIFKVFMNICLSHNRRQPDSLESTSSTETTHSDTPENSLIRDERKKAVHDQLEKLPERQHMAILLKFFSSMTHREIASAMDIEESSVSELISKAYKKLENNLKKLEN